MSRATLGLGSNLGDRLATLQRAVDELASRGVRALASSRVWATDPAGGPEDQGEFLNAVVRVDPGALEPMQLLAVVHEVEAALGRVRDVRWGPRTIDIDLLLWDLLVVATPDLAIPHPRMTQRAFVILPLLDLDPDPVLPDGTHVVDLPSPTGAARPYAPPLVLP